MSPHVALDLHEKLKSERSSTDPLQTISDCITDVERQAGLEAGLLNMVFNWDLVMIGFIHTLRPRLVGCARLPMSV